MGLPQASEALINLSLTPRWFTQGPGAAGERAAGAAGGAGTAPSCCFQFQHPPGAPICHLLVLNSACILQHPQGVHPGGGQSVPMVQGMDDLREGEQTPGSHSWSSAEVDMTRTLQQTHSHSLTWTPAQPRHTCSLWGKSPGCFSMAGILWV